MEAWLPEDIEKAKEIVHRGGVILYPTDTIWGLGCDATNARAVEKVYKIKKREKDKPLIVVVDTIDMLKDYVEDIHPRIETLLSYHERPLTIIYPQARGLADVLTGEDGSVGIRLTRDPYCKALINACDVPLVSTSANITDHPFPSRFGEISSEVLSNVDYVSKYRQNEVREFSPSVIARYDHKGHLEFLRS